MNIQVFSEKGPVHLRNAAANWKDLDYQRSVMASLVQGVYVLQHDYEKGRYGCNALAPPWWEALRFQLDSEILDPWDSSIFGAVFKYNQPQSTAVDPAAPRFVVAFRGTMFNLRDIKLDLFNVTIKNDLDRTTRFKEAMKRVRDTVKEAGGHQDVWLTGHSLGAAIATVAGKNMALDGANLRTFLFNPPFVSPPLEWLPGNRIKQMVLFANSLVTAGLALFMKGPRREVSTFKLLSSWVPLLFVHRSDGVSAAYIEYFANRRNLEDIGAVGLARMAAQHGLKDLILRFFGIHSESVHLMPSARLTENLSPQPKIFRAHALDQWWRPDLRLTTREYLYN